jgi:hypothetical protein
MLKLMRVKVAPALCAALLLIGGVFATISSPVALAAPSFSSYCAGLLTTSYTTQNGYIDQKGYSKSGALPNFPSSTYSWSWDGVHSLYSCDNWGTRAITSSQGGYLYTTYGLAFQCVELTARYAALRGDPNWTQLKQGASGYWGTSFTHWTKYANDTSRPFAGDILVWGDHVAVITSAPLSGTIGTVYYIQQNAFGMGTGGSTPTGTNHPTGHFPFYKITADGSTWYELDDTVNPNFEGFMRYHS